MLGSLIELNGLKAHQEDVLNRTIVLFKLKSGWL